MTVSVGFLALPRAHTPVRSPCTWLWSCALTLLKEEGTALHFYSKEFFPCTVGSCSATLQTLHSPSIPSPESFLIFPDYLHWPHCLLRWFKFWRMILKGSKWISVERGLSETSRLCTWRKCYPSRALNTRMAGCLDGNSTSEQIIGTQSVTYKDGQISLDRKF